MPTGYMAYGDLTIGGAYNMEGLLSYLKKQDIERYRAIIAKLGIRK